MWRILHILIPLVRSRLILPPPFALPQCPQQQEGGGRGLPPPSSLLPPQKESVNGESSTKGINMWRILHTRNQYVGGALHTRNQYVKGSPQKESICKASSSSLLLPPLPSPHPPKGGGSSTEGINVWRIIHTRNQYVGVSTQGINM